MLLVYTQKITPRITYVFKHICTRILGVEVKFTSIIEELISFEGAKLSYGKKSLGNELFIQSHGLLTQQGFESEHIVVKDWGDTKCFFSVTEKSSLPFDIFSAGFYLLSRYEEYLPHVKDVMGRFPAIESLGFNNGFLEQPVIDIWAYKFKSLLLKTYPDMVFLSRTSTIHTVIEANQPYAYKQRGVLRTFVGYTNDLIKLKFKRILDRTAVLFGVRNDPFDTFEWVVQTARKGNNQLTVFFMLGESLVFEESLNTRRRKFKLLVKYVADYENVGLIFSYDTLSNYEMLKKEKKRIENITNRDLQGSLNAHYLVNLPDSYRNLVELEIAKDFTMVYEDTPGFRAGTCTPFLFYDLDYEIKTPLIIHPISATTAAFKNKYASDITKTVEKLWTSVKAVNGTFSMSFTNKNFTPIPSNDVWRDLFSEKLHPNE